MINDLEMLLERELSEIKGIGEKTANKLLIHYGSVSKIKRSTRGELEKCDWQGLRQNCVRALQVSTRKP